MSSRKCTLCRGCGYIELPGHVEPCPSCTPADGVGASLGCGLLFLTALGFLTWGLFR